MTRKKAAVLGKELLEALEQIGKERTEKLAQIGRDAYCKSKDPMVGSAPLDEVPSDVKEAWVAAAEAIKAEVVKEYDELPTARETPMPRGFIELPYGRVLFRINTKSITAIYDDSDDDKGACLIYAGDNRFWTSLPPNEVLRLITEAQNR